MKLVLTTSPAQKNYVKKKTTSPVTGKVIFVLQTLTKVHPPSGDRQSGSMVPAFGPRNGDKKIESRMISRANATSPIIDQIRLGDSFANLNIACEIDIHQRHLVVKNETITLVRMTLIMTNKI